MSPKLAPHQAPHAHTVPAASQISLIRKALDAHERLLEQRTAAHEEREQIQRETSELVAGPDETIVQANLRILSLTRQIVQLDEQIHESGRTYIALVESNRAEWIVKQQKPIADARAGLAAAVDQLESALEHLASQQSLLQWLEHFPHPYGHGWSVAALGSVRIPGFAEPVGLKRLLDQLRIRAEEPKPPREVRHLSPSRRVAA